MVLAKQVLAEGIVWAGFSETTDGTGISKASHRSSILEGCLRQSLSSQNLMLRLTSTQRYRHRSMWARVHKQLGLMRSFGLRFPLCSRELNRALRMHGNSTTASQGSSSQDASPCKSIKEPDLHQQGLFMACSIYNILCTTKDTITVAKDLLHTHQQSLLWEDRVNNIRSILTNQPYQPW